MNRPLGSAVSGSKGLDEAQDRMRRLGPEGPPSKRSAWERVRTLAGDGANLRLAVLIVVLLVAFGALIGERFFSTASLQSMAYQLPELGILSLAMMVTLLSGGINLAVIATANLCALTMAFVLTRFVPGTEGVAWALWQVAALVAGLGVAGLIGLLNGYVIAYLRVSPILTTLGTMTLVKGISIGSTRGNVISGFPDPIVFIGNGAILGIPVALLVFCAVAVPLAVMLGRTPLGTSIYMIGSNEKATRFSGIDTRRVIMKVYVISSLLAAVAAIVMMARFNSANASYGESYLLVTILAAVLGGINPMGGFGKVGGLVLSLIMLQIISSAFNLLNFSPFLTLAIWGGILIAVAGATQLRQRLIGG
jgi:simple sugar transport system permease protein/ribose transport system permease protein